LRSNPARNLQVFEPLAFIAEVTQHIPEAGQHLIHYYGWYSNMSRGLRARSAHTLVCAVGHYSITSAAAMEQELSRAGRTVKVQLRVER
jgi:hypothetical protein